MAQSAQNKKFPIDNNTLLANGKVFDEDLLLREVTGIKAYWNVAFDNSPDFELEGPMSHWSNRDAYKQGMQYQQIADGSYFGYHPNGYVSFLYHSGTPVRQDGFGGAVFTLDMKGGGQQQLVGPWSSRPAAMNTNLDEEEWCVSTRGAHIRLAALLFLARHFKFPYYIVQGVSLSPEEKVANIKKAHPEAKPDVNSEWFRREHGPIVPSLSGEMLVKPREHWQTKELFDKQYPESHVYSGYRCLYDPHA